MYVAVQGQQNVNKFKLSMWDALFASDSYVANVPEGKNGPLDVITVASSYGKNYRYYFSQQQKELILCSNYKHVMPKSLC